MPRSNRVADLAMFEDYNTKCWIESIMAIERDNYVSENAARTRSTTSRRKHTIGEEKGEKPIRIGFKRSTFSWMQITSTILDVIM